ncbi:alpha/beta hydrolase [Microbulbifer magnicolonia]|uniref:alpha/beta hydrolase n=1 Tax=Microbulbifer magnicolonia TaxID=3109744 RepID=UPI002B418243|nr:alpha/beta hydrolase-fold protein [Microbulbifer sp. GG15]
MVELQDPQSQRIYPLFIKLPRSYTESPQRHYPVIYLTDAWYAFQIISGATRYPMGFGKMEEAIIVGISYSKGARGQSSRFRDYTPTRDGDWKSLTGNAANHARFIADTVFPYIDNNYRTKTGDRTFVGNSLGGLFGAYMLLTRPDMFDNYILGSPSVWFDDDVILTMDATPTDKKRRVFIAVGEQETPASGNTIHDMVAGAKRLQAKFDSTKGIRLESKLLLIPEATHETAFPTAAIQGLDWLYKKS